MIGAVTHDDYKRMAALVIDEVEHFYVFPSATYPMTVAQIKERVENKKEFVMIEEDGELIGFANLYDDEAKEYVFIGNFVIAKKHRTQGYGTKLMKHMITLARKKYHLSEIRISLVSTNNRAFDWYTNLGFTPYSVEVVDTHGLKFIHMKMAFA